MQVGEDTSAPGTVANHASYMGNREAGAAKTKGTNVLIIVVLAREQCHGRAFASW
jgi:hypothetical protein